MSGVISPKIASQVSTPNEKITVRDISEPVKTQEGKANKDQMPDIVGKIKDAVDQPIKSGKANTHIDFGIGDDPFSKKMLKMTDPKATVENIRNAEGNERDNALLGFQEKVDSMGTSDLKNTRDYLVKEMSSPTNKDDELLGSMLNMVNHKLDENGEQTHIIWNLKPNVIGEPFEKPIKIPFYENQQSGTEVNELKSLNHASEDVAKKLKDGMGGPVAPKKNPNVQED